MKLFRKLILLLLILFLVCGGTSVTACAEMVTREQFGDFDRTLKRDFQTSFLANCYNYTVTDRNGNLLASVIPESPTNHLNGIYTFDDDRLLLIHRETTGTRLKYPDSVYLYDTDYYIIEVNEDGLFGILPESYQTGYVINAVAGMKIVCDGYNITLTNPNTVSCHLEFVHYADNGDDYYAWITLNIGAEDSIFSIKDGILSYTLGYPQDLNITVMIIPQYGESYTDQVYTSEKSYVLDIGAFASSLPRTTKAAISWKKVSGAKRYVIYQKTDKGFVKVGNTKKTRFSTTILQDTVFKVKAQKKIRGKWKTIKIFKVTAKAE